MTCKIAHIKSPVRLVAPVNLFRGVVKTIHKKFFRHFRHYLSGYTPYS